MNKFIIKYIIFNLVIILTQALWASERDDQLWTQLIVTGPLVSKDHPLMFFLEYQARHSEQTNRSELGFIRPAIMYRLNPKYNLSLGYLSLKDYKFQEAEQRYWQQLQYYDQFSNINFQFRGRLEQRFRIDSLGTKTKSDVTHRIRMLLRFQFMNSLWKGFKPLLINELMINLNDSSSLDFSEINSGYDQNRLFIGFYKEISSVIATDLGYLHVNFLKGSGDAFYVNGGFITIYLKL